MMLLVGFLALLVLGWMCLFLVAIAVASRRAAKALEQAALSAQAQVILSQSMDQMQKEILSMNKDMAQAAKMRKAPQN